VAWLNGTYARLSMVLNSAPAAAAVKQSRAWWVHEVRK
jgi:hypothetical protein